MRQRALPLSWLKLAPAEAGMRSIPKEEYTALRQTASIMANDPANQGERQEEKAWHTHLLVNIEVEPDLRSGTEAQE